MNSAHFSSPICTQKIGLLELSKFELQFSNLEQLTNHFLARLLNQTRRALLITDQDVRTITMGLVRDPDAIYLLSGILNRPQVSEPPHASAVTTCGESELGADGVRELDDIGPGVYLTGSQDNQLPGRPLVGTAHTTWRTRTMKG